MSDLHKFQNSDAWRNNLKKFLSTKREPIAPKVANPASPRFSLGIEEELQNIIEKKTLSKNIQKGIAMSAAKKTPDDAAAASPAKDGPMSWRGKFSYDDTFLEEADRSQWHHTSDESFMLMEKICDKAVSDAESTLYHSQADHTLTQSQKGSDAEEAALQRLLQDLDIEKDTDLMAKHLDVTQLQDIEAPSHFWDNSIMHPQTSPVKMVGLLRPSTIMEENTEESISSEQSSQTSFQSASKNGSLEVSLSSYKTADDTTATTTATKKKTDNEVPLLQDSVIEDGETLSTIKNDDRAFSQEKEEENSHMPDGLKEEEPSSILSCSEADSVLLEKSTFNDSTSFEGENKENIDSTFDADESTNFNDTLEQVEYMMKKGMEYMTCTAEAKEGGASATPAAAVPPMLPMSSPKTFPAGRIYSPRGKATPKQSSKVALSGKPSQYAFDMRPVPKFDIFKKPLGAPNAHNLMPPHLAKNQFSHIISPVGAYVKRTPTTPFMTTMKAQTQRTDLFNATTFRDLEKESRLYQGALETSATAPKLPSVPQSLPKKAYISAQFKQIKDERTPLTIPGGQSIHKYLEAAMLPAVVRHEGKIKMPAQEGPDDGEKAPASTSMADFSIMSGDVSMYRIRDAQKF